MKFEMSETTVQRWLEYRGWERLESGSWYKFEYSSLIDNRPIDIERATILEIIEQSYERIAV